MKQYPEINSHSLFEKLLFIYLHIYCLMYLFHSLIYLILTKMALQSSKCFPPNPDHCSPFMISIAALKIKYWSIKAIGCVRQWETIKVSLIITYKVHNCLYLFFHTMTLISLTLIQIKIVGGLHKCLCDTIFFVR